MTSSNHLISNGYEDIESLVDSLPDPPVRTALVKFSKLGPFKLINVELNDQVHQLFEGITIKSDIVGFRLGWYQLVFFDLGNTDMIEAIIPISKRCASPCISNQVLIARTIGPGAIRLQQVSCMECQLAKIGKWQINLYGHYYENGDRVELPT